MTKPKTQFPRIAIAGPTSGVGKTTVTSSIISAIQKKKIPVQPYKVGPDFIDPSYLYAATGSKRKARNLDAWIMGGKKTILDTFLLHSPENFAVIEGVMGYYDGFSGGSNYASTYHIASTILKCPVILLVDASKAARSIAATIYGFAKYQRNSRICGVILNKVGSKRHADIIREALIPTGIPILGAIPNNAGYHMESRHLGLIPVDEQKSLEKKMMKIADSVSEHLDVDKIIEIGKNAENIGATNARIQKIHPKKAERKPLSYKIAQNGPTIAVAMDESFNFYYQDNMDSLTREGASIKYFSPIHDSKVPECDGIYIGGGYPEVLAAPLSKNKSMQKQIKKLAQEEVPIYGECGGLMYMTKKIYYDTKKYAMAGIFDCDTFMENKLKLNYTQATCSSSILSQSNMKVRGHEFHYSKIENIPRDSEFAFSLSRGRGISNERDGMVSYNTLGSYSHLHFSYPKIARNFVKSCAKYSRK